MCSSDLSIGRDCYTKHSRYEKKGNPEAQQYPDVEREADYLYQAADQTDADPEELWKFLVEQLAAYEIEMSSPDNQTNDMATIATRVESLQHHLRQALLAAEELRNCLEKEITADDMTQVQIGKRMGFQGSHNAVSLKIWRLMHKPKQYLFSPARKFCKAAIAIANILSGKNSITSSPNPSSPSLQMTDTPS